MKMNGRVERAYKRICFQGRGAVARWTDRAFFALLGGVCLYLLCRNVALSCVFSAALLGVFLLWESRRWTKYKRDLWQKTVRALKREDWLRQEGIRIRQAGGTILYPTPDAGAMLGFCLRFGAGTAFHCFGDAKIELIAQAKSMGCSVAFHPWQEGVEPSRERVLERLERDAPKRERKLWQSLRRLPGSRYLLTGCALLGLSMVLRRALYWRLLGSLCLMIGAIRRALHMPKT